MSPYVLSDADVAVTELGAKRRAGITVAEATEDHIADLFAEFAEALRDGDFGRMQLIRDHASAIDPGLVAELDGFDYPAAA
jgi:hypothetical protein